MKTTEQKVNEIQSVIIKHRLVKDRVNELHDLGYTCFERRCGSGGKGQVINLKNEIRVQIGYGHGKQNYAMCVIINK